MSDSMVLSMHDALLMSMTAALDFIESDRKVVLVCSACVTADVSC